MKQALLVAAVIGSMISGVAVAVDQAAFGFLLGLVVGAGIAILYYILNKTTTIGVVESGGLLSGLSFKRSVIEGQAISEKDGRRVIDIIRARIEDKTN